MICERCGNEYFRKVINKEDGKRVTWCPYCKYENEYIPNKKKKKNKRCM